LADSFFRVGSLVFGGGHVVLPLLQAEVVPNGWISKAHFLAGYGATQAMPGPLFSFAAFLGASISGLNPWLGGLLCLGAIFAPSFLLVAGTLPFWAQLRQYPQSRAALAGINASVVGLLLAVFYQPAWTGAVQTPLDAIAAFAIFLALQYAKMPPLLAVLLCACLGGWI
jgi:chromate transporter